MDFLKIILEDFIVLGYFKHLLINYLIRLTIDSISFPKFTTPALAKDYIEIYHGDNKFASKIVDKFTQSSLSKNIDLVSRTNRLLHGHV